MASDWDALRQALLFVGWPGLAITSTYAIIKAVAFYRGLRHSAPGLLVLMTISGWIVTLAATAMVMTFYFMQSPDDAGPVVLPVFILWAGSMVTIVWVVQRWGAETATLDSYYGEVERMERMKSGFINHVAHELNTPITPLRMQLSLFKHEELGPLTERQAGSLVKMERNVDRLSGLVEQVLLASRLQAGNITTYNQNTDVVTVLRAVTTMLPDGRLELDVPDHCLARIDGKQMGYALEALFAHLLRTEPEGQAIEVALHAANRPTIDISYHGREINPRHFEMFHDPVEAAGREGLALELFNVHGLLTMQGADVAAVGPGRLRVTMVGPGRKDEAPRPQALTRAGL